MSSRNLLCSLAAPVLLGALAALATLAAAACSGHTEIETSGQSSSTGSGSGAGTGGDMTTTGGTGATGATGAGAGDAGDQGADASGPPDGTPTRVACTGAFGNALTATHGRMDGYLVTIIPPGQGAKCNGDSGHVHLQVMIGSAVYDVAINTDVLYDSADLPLPGGAWAEGWHPGENLDYPTTLGLHAAGFTTTDPAALATMVESELAAVNHISVFGTGYGPTGAHDIHRQEGAGQDGAIAVNPLSPNAHLLAFRFSTDSF